MPDPRGRFPLPRLLAWTALVLFGALRPGVDALDRWLMRPAWEIPSLWDSLAEVALRAGTLDPDFGGRAAPWRQVCVQRGTPRLAVIVFSDRHRSRVTLLDQRYRVVGTFERATTDPDLVEDETRGYKPLSHIWPLRDGHREGRIETLVAFSPLRSGPLDEGTFAFLSLGPDRNELLFLGTIRSGRELPGVVLEHLDLDGDGYEDLAVFPSPGRRAFPEPEQQAMATLRWNHERRTYEPRLAPGAGVVFAYWSTAPGDRVYFRRDEALDERARPLAARLRPPG